MENHGSLVGLLSQRARSPAKRSRILAESAEELGLGEGGILDPICVSYALLKLDTDVGVVSRLLSWRDFERLVAALFRASGFEVKENLHLRKPRAQIDLVAFGTSTILAVDCKHWERGLSPSALARVAREQLSRCEKLRRTLDDKRPIAAVILAAVQPEGTFVEGVPVVPVRTLSTFAREVETYYGHIDLR